jgi:hypothetical protein
MLHAGYVVERATLLTPPASQLLQHLRSCDIASPAFEQRHAGFGATPHDAFEIGARGEQRGGNVQ